MDLDAVLRHFFGTADIDALDQSAIDDGREKVAIAFGTEREPGRRFALWAVLRSTGDAPDPRDAFEDLRERRAAAMYASAIAVADRSD
ncbi:MULTISPECIES: hypothetical protein [unclassified Sphingomonas]|uniref:hypothetical protein n=1 Tax=unclassified Sphingomonas TaxID=196159 RepID=UPI0006F7456B|nr:MULTISPECIES: hypothetical protein [unclassified Sphingomonas]KQS48883.1 hypothetical protein ASG20_07195 [Sphingomonas sp. Leaf198]